MEVIVLPVETETLLRPCALQDLQHFGEPFAAFGVRHTVRLIDARKSAAPDTKDQPSMADVIDRRRFLRQLQRMAERQHLHRRPDPHPLGPRCDGSRDSQRRGENRAFRCRMQFRQPHDVQAVTLRCVHLLERLGERVFFSLPRHSLKLVEHAEFHGRWSPCVPRFTRF